MPYTEAERAQVETEMLLRYVVLKLRADSGALLRPRPEAPLLLVARTELWPHAAYEQVATVWAYSKRRLLSGDPERRGAMSILPLFAGGSPQLEALLALTGLRQDLANPGPHTPLFELLVRQVTLAVAPPPIGDERQAVEADPFPAGARNQVQEAMRRRIEEELRDCRGNVTQAARRLELPLRTLWGHIQRLEIEPARFRLRSV